MALQPRKKLDHFIPRWRKTLRRRLAFLRVDSYEEYLKSAHWQGLRARFKAELSGCFVCGNPQFQLHHRNYRRLGAEKLSDLVPLCKTHHDLLHYCYDKEHFKQPRLSLLKLSDQLLLRMRDDWQKNEKESEPFFRKKRTKKRGIHKGDFSVQGQAEKLNRLIKLIPENELLAMGAPVAGNKARKGWSKRVLRKIRSYV